MKEKKTNIFTDRISNTDRKTDLNQKCKLTEEETKKKKKKTKMLKEILCGKCERPAPSSGDMYLLALKFNTLFFGAGY